MHQRTETRVSIPLRPDSYGNKQGLSDSDKSERKINRKEIEYDRVKVNLIVPE